MMQLRLPGGPRQATATASGRNPPRLHLCQRAPSAPATSALASLAACSSSGAQGRGPQRHHQARRSRVLLRATQQADFSETREDFYSLFGVRPDCTNQEIRAAYRNLMRELHPDLAAASMDEEMQEQATTLAVLINEIHETLCDPEKRATYNALSGFSNDNSPNPFEDSTFPRDQTFVDELSCIGCGMCVRACPETFEIEESMYGRARVTNQQGNNEEEIQIATEVCPVECIHHVTLPQLSLLEAALAVMPRTSAFVLQRDGGAGGNVFWEAFKAYERRRNAINDRAQANATKQQQQQQQQQQQARTKGDWSFWSTPSPSSSGDTARPGQEQRQPMTGEEQRIANLAAIAARASRLWRQNGNSIRPPAGALK